MTPLEKLFKEVRENSLALKDSNLYDTKTNQKHYQRRLVLKEVLRLVIEEEMDPVMAKLTVPEDFGTPHVIDGSRIVCGSITANRIAAGSITASKISANSITASKLSL